MPLTSLILRETPVSDLSPLKGMPLTRLYFGFGTPIKDLAPLAGMPLTELCLGGTPVSDLSPLKGMPLTLLVCDRTLVSDLSPLKGVPLEARDLSDGHLERAMQVNAFGPLRVTQRFLPLLERGAGKTIVDVSSEAGSIESAWRTCELEYSMSKAALNMQTRLLANALGPRGYRVVAVHPGWMRTDMGGTEADIASEEASRGIFRLATDPRAQTLLSDVSRRSAPVLAVRENVMRALSDTENPQGIAAVYPIPNLPLPAQPRRLLILDRLRDPGNVGTILRSAEAAGAIYPQQSPSFIDRSWNFEERQ